MNGLEHDFPNVKFVYMTGHTDGAALTGNVSHPEQADPRLLQRE